jgi:hypothetical protein
LLNYPPKLLGNAVDSPETCDFVSLCVYYGLELFVKEKIDGNILGSMYMERRASTLLGYTLATGYDEHQKAWVRCSMMQVFLGCGANPNERHGRSTLWHAFMSSGGEFFSSTDTRLEVIKLLLLHGADPTIKLDAACQLVRTHSNFRQSRKEPEDFSGAGNGNPYQAGWSLREVLEEYRELEVSRDCRRFSDKHTHLIKGNIHKALQLIGEITQILDQLETGKTTHNGNCVGILLPHEFEHTTSHGKDHAEHGFRAPLLIPPESANGQDEGMNGTMEDNHRFREDGGERGESIPEIQGQEIPRRVEALQTEGVLDGASKAERRFINMRMLLCCLV